jgi:anti-sigma B factor antagonist
MSPLIHVTEEWHGEVPVARVDGEIDASNVQELAARIRRLLTNRSTTLVIDLTPTAYIDSAGINLLFTIGEELRGRQQVLHLVIPEQSPVGRMLAITGADKVHPTHRAVADALSRA